MRKLFVLSGFLGCLAAVAPVASADVINFNEIIRPNLSSITNQYSAYDVIFSNSIYVQDNRLSDDYGIAAAPSPATINFIAPVSDVTINWVSIDTSFFATAYDTNNNIVSAFAAVPCGDGCLGSAFLAGSDISKIIWHDDTGYVGIDSLSFNLPEPSAVFFLLLTFAWMAFIARRKNGHAARV